MTLAPSRNLGPRLRITTYDAEYALPTSCEWPWCPQPGTEAHHVEPRSRTAGPKNWIEIDGFPVRNKVKTCKRHHDMLTGGIGGHKAKLVWDGGWAAYEREGEGWKLAGWIDELSSLRQEDS